ncbi:MAG: hypothetical protein WA921_04255 [Ahrensia sp.]
MVGTDYVFYHLECIINALKGDDNAVDAMDITEDGFWRSFAAILYSLPALFFMWVISARSPEYVPVERSMGLRIAYDAAFDIGVWLVLIAVLVLVLGQLGYTRRLTHFVVARNWTTLLFNYAMAFAFIPSMFGADAGPGTLLLIIMLVVIVWAFVRITRQSLQCSAGFAALIVMGELLAVTALGIFLAPSVV